MTKSATTSKKTRKQYTPNFVMKHRSRLNASVSPLLPANLAYMNPSSTTGAANSRIRQLPSERESKQAAEIAHLKRQLAEQDEELAILKNGAMYFACA